MALVYDDLLGHHDKVQQAVSRLKCFEPPDEPYYGAFSGGKDSQCIYHLAELAGVKVEWHYAVTSVDPPPLVKFIKDYYPDVHRDIPHYTKDYTVDGKVLRKAGEPITMWKLIVDRQMPPTRKARYCCAVLKEPGGQGRVTITGVRWEESVNRRKTHGVVDLRGAQRKVAERVQEFGAEAKSNGRDSIILNNDNDASRQVVEHCFQKAKTTVNPIIDWTEEDVWEFLNDVVKVPHCELYDQGWKRLGCIGCPMAAVEERRKSFEWWPKYKDAYIRAFQRMIDLKSARADGRLFTEQTLVSPPPQAEQQSRWPDESGRSEPANLSASGQRTDCSTGSEQSGNTPPIRSQVGGANGHARTGWTGEPCADGGCSRECNGGIGNAETRNASLLAPPENSGTYGRYGTPGLPVPDSGGTDMAVSRGNNIHKGRNRYTEYELDGTEHGFQWGGGGYSFHSWMYDADYRGGRGSL